MTRAEFLLSRYAEIEELVKANLSVEQVVLDIESKRALVDAAVEVLGHSPEHVYWSRARSLAETILWQLAASYQGHPDYQKLDGR